MSNSEIIDADLTGSCQCGAVRFRVTMRPVGMHYCHCRMCQRAVGNLFAALCMVRGDRLEWTKGQPATFKSSSVAERGFCRDCGTPLTFHYHVSPNYGLTIGSFDDPTIFAPVIHYGIESHVPGHKIGDNLPREATDPEEARLKGIVSYQSTTV